MDWFFCLKWFKLISFGGRERRGEVEFMSGWEKVFSIIFVADKSWWRFKGEEEGGEGSYYRRFSQVKVSWHYNWPSLLLIAWAAIRLWPRWMLPEFLACRRSLFTELSRMCFSTVIKQEGLNSPVSCDLWPADGRGSGQISRLCRGRVLGSS